MILAHRVFIYLAIFCVALMSCTAGKVGAQLPIYAMDPNDIFQDPEARELAWAAGRGDIRRIEELIEMGVNVNFVGVFGITPLWWPVQRTNILGFEKLLQLGADPNHYWDTGQSVMSHVPSLADSQFTKLALEYGGNPNLVNPRSLATPIFSAAMNPGSSLQNIDYLIDAGADLNIRDAANFPPIIWAATRDRYDIIHRFIVAGADFEARLSSGRDIGFYMNRRRGWEEDIRGMSAWRKLVVEELRRRNFVIPGESYAQQP